MSKIIILFAAIFLSSYALASQAPTPPTDIYPQIPEPKKKGHAADKPNQSEVDSEDATGQE